MDPDIENFNEQDLNLINLGSSRNSRRSQAHSRAYSSLVSAGPPSTEKMNGDNVNGETTPDLDLKSAFAPNSNHLYDSAPITPTQVIDSPFESSNLGFLASANFSSESLSNPSVPMNTSYSSNSLNSNASSSSQFQSLGSGLGIGPGLGLGSNQSPYSSRRYSGQSLTNSPVLQASASSTKRSTNPATSSNVQRPQRPKSAIFLMDSNNFAISEDGSPIQDAIDNTPRARSSYHFGRSSASQAYIPTAPIAPPTGPSGQNSAAGVAGGSAHSSRSTSRATSPVRSRSPTKYGRSISPIRKPLAYSGPNAHDRSSSPKRYQPFNFQPQEVMSGDNHSTSSLSVKPAHRKGHKYKHSSVSMNLFQEPPPALKNLNNRILSIPDSYPIPNFTESLNSITHTQKLKLIWSMGHVLLSVIVFVVGIKLKMPTLSTLAHLIFYDALGSLVIVFVDIMSNFEVWNSSSIQYPFGLGRLEVLVGFALSTSLIMVGLDLISHSVEEFVIELAVGGGDHLDDIKDHSSHHIHGEHHGDKAEDWIAYELILILSIIITLISSNYILFYERINKMISNTSEDDKRKLFAGKNKASSGGILNDENSFSSPSSLSSESHFDFFVKGYRLLRNYWNVMSRNPTHFLTLIYSTYLMIVPILPTQLGLDIDIDLNESTTLVVALLLCYNGWKLAMSLGSILLLSYPYSDYQYYLLKSKIADRIEQLDCFKKTYTIEQLFITKFNYELYVVGVRIMMRGGSNEIESVIRFEVNRIIRGFIDEDTGSLRKNEVEITIDINRY